jgi:hypothetical protein
MTDLKKKIAKYVAILIAALGTILAVAKSVQNVVEEPEVIEGAMIIVSNLTNLV